MQDQPLAGEAPIGDASASPGLGDAGTVFALLAGRWRIERSIPQQAHFAGEACFSPRGAQTLDYLENGTLALPDGTALAARRAYRYCLETPYIDIAFADGPSDGQLFVRLVWHGEAREWRAAEAHQCIDDQYQVSLRFESERAFVMQVRAWGPRKAYATLSRFEKIDQPC